MRRRLVVQENDVQSKVLRTLVYYRAYDTTVTIETKADFRHRILLQSPVCMVCRANIDC
jgi:hypothetical protein